jgi:hypothetical protein
MTVISFFNNAAQTYTQVTPNALRAPYSSGLVVALDNSSSPMTATMIKKFDNPDRVSSTAQGSMRQLPNGNFLIGWGNAGSLSEFTSDGQLVFHAKFDSPLTLSYRAYKYNFTAAPETKPDLWTYSLSPDSPTVFYVSWNGATEVASWNFYTCDGDAVLLGREVKKGFETAHVSQQSHNRTFAEAIALDGRSLGNSTCVTTFVPSDVLRVNCRVAECSMPNLVIHPPPASTSSSHPLHPPTGDSSTSPGRHAPPGNTSSSHLLHPPTVSCSTSPGRDARLLGLTVLIYCIGLGSPLIWIQMRKLVPVFDAVRSSYKGFRKVSAGD